jgi:V8-like Glu-specific endopeptidase
LETGNKEKFLSLYQKGDRAMARKPRKSRPGRRAPRDERPLSHDELLQRDNVPAEESMPEEISRRFSERSIYVSGLKRSYTPEKQKGEASTQRWTLPGDAIVGLPGKTATRLPPPTTRSRAAREVTLEPFRPRWVDHVYHPKRTVPQHWARGPVERPGVRGEVFWGVYPPDERAVFYPSGYPWNCIGKVYAWNNASATWPAWSGSGVLIGDRIVLTAGHNVPWDASSWMMQFIPAYYDGGSILGAGASSFVSDTRGWDVSYYSRLPDAHDMAILRLFEPLGTWLGFYGSKQYYSGFPEMRFWNIVGYPGAVASAERPSYQPGIEVLGVKASGDAIEVHHHGDISPGNSGGPYWATWPDGYPYATGTISGGRTVTSGGQVIEDTNVAAGGVALNDLVRWGRTNWP